MKVNLVRLDFTEELMRRKPIQGLNFNFKIQIKAWKRISDGLGVACQFLKSKNYFMHKNKNQYKNTIVIKSNVEENKQKFGTENFDHSY